MRRCSSVPSPVLPAGICRVGASHIEYNINIFQDIRILPDIVKADKFHIKGGTAQCLDNTGIGIILLRRGSLYVVVQGPELLADTLHIVDEIRELHSQLQVSAVTDPVDGLSKDSSSSCHPFYLCLLHRVAALVEGIREEVGKKTSQ